MNPEWFEYDGAGALPCAAQLPVIVRGADGAEVAAQAGALAWGVDDDCRIVAWRAVGVVDLARILNACGRVVDLAGV